MKLWDSYASFAEDGSTSLSNDTTFAKVETDHRVSRTLGHKIRTGVVLIAIVSAAVYVLTSDSKRTHLGASNENELLAEKTVQTTLRRPANYDMKLSAKNEYGDTSQLGIKYTWLNGMFVVEPGRLTTLTVKLEPMPKDQSRLDFLWNIEHSKISIENNVKVNGSSVEHKFTQTGPYFVTIKAIDLDSMQIMNEKTFDARCIYVKREVRSMLISDREAFLDAFSVIWDTNTEDGQKKYGHMYTGIDRFAIEHATQASGDIKCDHWHDGTGFLTHHLAMTMSFDLSLRTVDPAVTLPYWDFTLEGERLYRLGEGPSKITEVSPLFTHAWFGSTDELSHVKDSRWAHTPAITAIVGEKTRRNSYGYVRAPWNNARDSELIRHVTDVCGIEPANKPIPTCYTHFSLTNITSLASWLVNAAGNGHGPVHVNTGGMFGECSGMMSNMYDDHEDLLAQNFTVKGISDMILAKTGVDNGWVGTDVYTLKEIVTKMFHLEYFHIYRMLWRSHTCALDGQSEILQCPKSCDKNTPESECICTCQGIDPVTRDDSKFDWENVEPCMYVSDEDKLIAQTIMPESFRKTMITNICSTGVKEGELLESASPADPIFFIIHPIIDRMLTAKRLAETQEIHFGEWGLVPPFESMEWLDYSFYSEENYTCSGHGMHDAVLPNLPLPANLIKFADQNGDGHLSNIEFWEGVDPNTNGGVDYIFDSFEWPHCDFNYSDAGSQWTGQEYESLSSSEPSFDLPSQVVPAEWSGDPLRTLMPSAIVPSQTLEEYHSDVAAYMALKGSPEAAMPGIDLRTTLGSSNR